MSEDKTWMHRAFPTLAPADAEEIANSLTYQYYEELKGMFETADRLDNLSYPPTSSCVEEMEPDQLFRRFVTGDEPLPDLATAEVVRRELHYLLSSWLRASCHIQSICISNAHGMKVHRPDAHRRRYVLWLLCKGDIGRTGVVKDLARQLDRDPMLCEQFGFHVGTSHAIRKNASIRFVSSSKK